MQFAPKVVDKVWSTARSLGYSNYFISTNSPGIMDDHIFVNRDAKIGHLAGKDLGQRFNGGLARCVGGFAFQPQRLGHSGEVNDPSGRDRLHQPSCLTA